MPPYKGGQCNVFVFLECCVLEEYLVLRIPQPHSLCADLHQHLLAPEAVSAAQMREARQGLLHTSHLPTLQGERHQVLGKGGQERGQTQRQREGRGMAQYYSYLHVLLVLLKCFDIIHNI